VERPSTGIDCDFFGKLLRHIHIQDSSTHFKAADIRILAAYQPYRVVVVAVNRMEWFAGDLRAEISPTRTEVEVVEMPYDGRPSVVQHPLNDSRGVVFVAAERFKHRPFAFVRNQLRFPCEVFDIVRGTIPLFDGGLVKAN